MVLNLAPGSGPAFLTKNALPARYANKLCPSCMHEHANHAVQVLLHHQLTETHTSLVLTAQ